MLILSMVLVLSSVAAQSVPPALPADKGTGQESTAGKVSPGTTSASLGSLPPSPKGKSTVIGGEITKVDPVRDQFMLKVFGAKGKPVKILFDERTQVFENGKRVRLLDLHPVDHASIETTLDGTTVFALRIHTLSQLPEGETQGRVINFNLQNGELTVNTALSKEAITLRVPSDVGVAMVGQHASASKPGALSDISRGTLVDVKFTSGKSGRGVATHIDILATPGSTFVFDGNLAFLDSHAGRLTVVDPSDDQSYQIVYDPAHFHISNDLHTGLRVRVATTFDGSKYVASEITME
jgi:hypothetical protein